MCHVQERQLWLSYFWSYLPFLCLNFIWRPLCNVNTLRNIMIILDKYVELNKMTYCVQERLVWLSYFWSYLSFLCLNLCLLCNSNILWIILIILDRNVEQDETFVLRTKMATLAFLFFSNLPFLCLNVNSCPRCNSNVLYSNLMILVKM